MEQNRIDELLKVQEEIKETEYALNYHLARHREALKRISSPTAGLENAIYAAKEMGETCRILQSQLEQLKENEKRLIEKFRKN